LDGRDQRTEGPKFQRTASVLIGQSGADELALGAAGAGVGRALAVIGLFMGAVGLGHDGSFKKGGVGEKCRVSLSISARPTQGRWRRNFCYCQSISSNYQVGRELRRLFGGCSKCETTRPVASQGRNGSHRLNLRLKSIAGGPYFGLKVLWQSAHLTRSVSFSAAPSLPSAAARAAATSTAVCVFHSASSPCGGLLAASAS
jgi:hypothetical protein